MEPVPFGVYVHVPFCARRCDYCAFATWTDRHHLMAEYMRACRIEIERADLAPATSVFFGGGTPSLLPADELAAVLDSIRRAPGAEVTVECNPDTVTTDLLRTYRDAGVNRISLGAQSFDTAVLASLGRDHCAEAVVDAVALIGAAGFSTFSVDLIYGAAGETLASWTETVRRVLELRPAPPHVSAYALTVESGTPLARDPDRHPDDDDQADKYLAADAALAGAGLLNYEISNWARPGHQCAHNLLYWRQGDYRGIGCAAHSHCRGRRWWNVRTPERYIAAVTNGRAAAAGHEVLSDDAVVLERLQLGLRTAAGVEAAAFADDDLRPLIDRGLVNVGGGRAVLTARGRLLSNDVATRLRVTEPVV